MQLLVSNGRVHWCLIGNIKCSVHVQAPCTAASITFPTNPSFLCKLCVFCLSLGTCSYYNALFFFFFCTNKKASQIWLICDCKPSGGLFRNHSGLFLYPLVVSPLPLPFLKSSLWFMNRFSLTSSCFPSRTVVFAYILREAKPICFSLNFCQLKLLSVLFSAWGL